MVIFRIFDEDEYSIIEGKCYGNNPDVVRICELVKSRVIAASPTPDYDLALEVIKVLGGDIIQNTDIADESIPGAIY